MITDFEGKLGVVSGAGGGIGREIARQLHGRGMRVGLLDIDEPTLFETRALLGAGAAAFICDVSDQRSVEAAAARVREDLGATDILINCAGRLGPFEKRIWEYDNDEWAGLLDVNLYGVINCVRTFLPVLRASTSAAHIAIIASTAGVLPQHCAGAYAASKHALVSFGETLCLELEAEHANVGVSIVCPGAVRTNFNAAVRASRPGVGEGGAGWQGPDDVAACVLRSLESGSLYGFTHGESRAKLEEYHRLLASFA
ncbi:MAG TPA: SDR family oxidoreductase [Acidimicrobiales bacterium]|nr:SDR family oxidoreductase [Acidimicrobiales bacterium]